MGNRGLYSLSCYWRVSHYIKNLQKLAADQTSLIYSDQENDHLFDLVKKPWLSATRLGIWRPSLEPTAGRGRKLKEKQLSSWFSPLELRVRRYWSP